MARPTPHDSERTSAEATVCRDGPCIVVQVVGEHDAANKTVLASAIGRAIAINGADVVLDLEGLDFMDASTVDSIVVGWQQLNDDARRLTIRHAPRNAQRVLHICSIGDLMEDEGAPLERLHHTQQTA